MPIEVESAFLVARRDRKRHARKPIAGTGPCPGVQSSFDDAVHGQALGSLACPSLLLERVRLGAAGQEIDTAATRHYVCESHTLLVMNPNLEQAINEWHASVNAGDLQRSAGAVGDPVVVLGPKGAGPITPAQFAEWVERSGITLIPRSWHPVSERLMVVEEDATWPESTEFTRVATVFRACAGKVTAALRLPDLRAALELAYICREMAATE